MRSRRSVHIGGFIVVVLSITAAAGLPASAGAESPFVARPGAVPATVGDGESWPDAVEQERLEELAAGPFNLASQEMLATVRAVNAEYPDVASAFWVDYETESVFVSYAADAEPRRIDAYRSEFEAVPGAYPYVVVAGAFVAATQQELARSTAQEPELWAETLGGMAYAVGALPDGTIFVQFEQGSERPMSIVIHGITVEVLAEPANGSPQTRSGDTSPFATGIRIWSPSSGCTLGFTWQRWYDLAILGSTAAHCGGGAYERVAYGATIANSSTSVTAVDTVLLAPTGGYAFSTTSWADETSEYSVVGAAVLGTGSIVALSAATSGTHVSVVDYVGYYYSGWGPMTTTWSNLCQDGDSGGPWQTSTGGPEVIAHGQHSGLYYTRPGLGPYCAYVDVGTISGGVQATLVTT